MFSTLHCPFRIAKQIYAIFFFDDIFLQTSEGKFIVDDYLIIALNQVFWGKSKNMHKHCEIRVFLLAHFLFPTKSPNLCIVPDPDLCTLLEKRPLQTRL